MLSHLMHPVVAASLRAWPFHSQVSPLFPVATSPPVSTTIFRLLSCAIVCLVRGLGRGAPRSTHSDPFRVGRRFRAGCAMLGTPGESTEISVRQSASVPEEATGLRQILNARGRFGPILTRQCRYVAWMRMVPPRRVQISRRVQVLGPPQKTVI